jgi:23S rRNA pseudouridine1911/1915/1917 synthase
VNQTLAIVHEDPHCLAVVKPPGQFTQGSWAPPDEITLETAVRRYLNPGDPTAVYLGIVHRLDRPTSGLLIWAKTPKAARRLSSQFERRRVVKEYWAIVESEGPTTGRTGREETWTDWLTHADAKGVVSVAPTRAVGAREAITRVRFETAGRPSFGFMWLRLWPQTGRTHQLRVQSAARGMPIVGDVAYGATIPTAIAPGIALHARSLSLKHPITGIEITLVAPLPATWAEAGVALPAASEERPEGDDKLKC